MTWWCWIWVSKNFISPSPPLLYIHFPFPFIPSYPLTLPLHHFISTYPSPSPHHIPLPSSFLSQLVECVAFNHMGVGSIPIYSIPFLHIIQIYFKFIIHIFKEMFSIYMSSSPTWNSYLNPYLIYLYYMYMNPYVNPYLGNYTIS